MASISVNSQEKVYSLKQWLGMKESPDGDTKLKFGQASSMVNFKVTRDGNLRKRNGTVQLYDAGTTVQNLWTGWINGKYVMLAAADNKLIELYSDNVYTGVVVGNLDTSQQLGFVPAGGNLYIFNGSEYLVYDGTLLTTVVGYIPLVVTNLTPLGEGLEYEEINKLTAKRKIWLNPDGTSTVWTMPEPIKELVSVTDRATGLDIACTLTDTTTITFDDAPAQGVDTIEVLYKVASSYRYEVEQMRFGELCTGVGDVRILAYGDGSNAIFYTDVDYNGNIRFDYFPDLNVINVGSSNTPVTGIVRHNAEIICYKSDSCYTLQDSLTELTDGRSILEFTVKNVNRAIGNAPYGPIPLVLNYPYTLYQFNLYAWHSNSQYTSNLSYDERNCDIKSDNVYKSLRDFNFSKTRMFDVQMDTELWICYGSKTLVYNYALDCWYIYSGLEVTAEIEYGNKIYLGLDDGRIVVFSDKYENDCGTAIRAQWVSGSYSFDQTYKRKFSAMLWIGQKSIEHGSLNVKVDTDRGTVEGKQTVSSGLFAFSNLNFADFSFSTKRRPQIKKLKLKVKKFVYYRLTLYNYDANTSCVVTDVDIKVRPTGDAK